MPTADKQHDENRSPLFQEGFLAILLGLAVLGLVALLWPFLPGLFLATVLAASTYPLYLTLQQRWHVSAQNAALLMTSTVFFLVLTPVTYLLTMTGVVISRSFMELKGQISALSAAEMGQLQDRLLRRLPLPDELQRLLSDSFSNHVQQIAGLAKEISVGLFQTVLGNTAAFVSSLFLIVFALFFFYRDGPVLVRQIKILSPLANRLDDILLHRFSLLATVLTLSTLLIALVQAISISLITGFMGLPWFTLGVAVAVTSFIPIMGSMIVWGPACYWLWSHEQGSAAVLLLFWGGVVNGFLVDNLLRPLLIQRLSRWAGEKGEYDQTHTPLSHTLLTVLSTLGGIWIFGILGLLFGPLIAAMAITIFEIYELEYGHRLDYSGLPEKPVD
ncbi:MAG: AI-2E family transporter [Magnetococcales bacterium]|nr:AI-2E family transporter [Magnetococcales bacterium]